MAPEIISSKGHSCIADYWSLGVLLYEMVTGHTPYYDKSGDIFKIYNRIMNERLRFPLGPLSNELMALISALLFPNPAKRIGAFKRGVADIKEHAWFTRHDFKWTMLSEKRLQTPYVPSSSTQSHRETAPTVDMTGARELDEKALINWDTANRWNQCKPDA